MKKLVFKYQVSKFRCFINGLLFAVITFAAVTLCILQILNPASDKTEILLPFCIAIVSMLMGFISMFRNNATAKRHYKIQN